MDFRKSEILLEKISALHKSMSSDPDQISPIELDLMKSYLRQLYGLLMEAPVESSSSEVTLEIIKAKPATPKAVSAPAAAPPPPAPVPESQPLQPPPPEEEVTPPSPPTIPTREFGRPASAPPAENIPDGLDELFAFETPKELLEKLSDSPISDIGKAMGYNDRAFTVNELFDGDNEAFKRIILTLNSLSSFEEAKSFLLANTAIKYDWTAKERVKKAKNFIKLVKRRYQ